MKYLNILLFLKDMKLIVYWLNYSLALIIIYIIMILKKLREKKYCQKKKEKILCINY